MKAKVFSNIGLKVLSLIIAVLLWVFVTYRGQTEMVVDVPVEFKNMPQGMELLKQSIKTVSLNIRGHEKTLKTLRPMDIRLQIDLASAKKGETIFYIDADNVTVPKTIKVLRVDPTRVKVSIDESMSKRVPVKVHIVGLPENGYKIKSSIVDPQFVDIEGAKTEVSGISILRTEPVDISGADADITQKVRLNTGGRNIRIGTSEVDVRIKIERIRR